MKPKQTRIRVGRRYVVLCAEFCLCTIMLLVVIGGHVDAQFHELHLSFGLSPHLLALDYSEGDAGLSYIHNPMLVSTHPGSYWSKHYMSAPSRPGIGWFDYWVNEQAMPGLSAIAMNNARKKGLVICRGVRISFWYLDGIFFAWWLLYLSRYRRARLLRKLQRNLHSRVCVYCLYDLHGLDEHTICPECGGHNPISEPDRIDPV